MTYTYPEPANPQNSESYAEQLALDTYFNYPKNKSVTGCCGLYSIPYVYTDVFQFFVAETPDTLELRDENDITISGGITNTGNLITIDFDGITAKKVQVIIDGVCQDFAFENYSAPSQGCCDGFPSVSSLVLSSEWCERDLLDNDFTVEGFTNKVRIYGHIYEIDQPEPEITRNDRGRMTKKKIVKNYELITQNILRDSFLYNHLKDSVFTGERLKIVTDSGKIIVGFVRDSIGEIKGNFSRFVVRVETFPEIVKSCC